MAGSRTLKLNILAETKDLVDGLKKADDETQAAGSKISEGFKKVGVAVAAAGAAVGAFAVKLAVDGIKAASDLSETLSKTNVIFDKSADKIVEFANKAASSLGQTKQQALDAAATFATFGKSAGLAGDDLVKFSTDFTVLASDLASFNNTTPEEAINAIGAALRGEAEPLRRYGVLLDDASMRQKALELGIIDSIKNALTPQQKVLAAQALIFEQTNAAQGDFARTSDGLANSQRILSAQLENVKATIGMALLPVMTELVSNINNNVIPLFERFANQFNESVAPSLNKVVEVLRDFLVPIFQALWLFISEELVPLFVRIYEKVVPVLVAAFQSIINKVKENKESFQPLIDILKVLWEFISNVFIPLALDALVANFKVAVRGVEFFIDALAWLMRTLRPVLDLLERMLELITRVGRFLVDNLGFGGGGGGGGGGMGFTVPNTPSLPPASASGASFSGSGTTIINVNGTVIDPEGAARAITDVLNRSVDRAGGLGIGGGAGFLVAPAV